MKPSRFAAAVVVVFAAAVTAGCASGSPASGSSVLPPIMADVSSLDGSTVEVPLGNTLVITGDDTTYADWTADIDDESILTFTPGHDDGGAAFNPGFQTKKQGTTEVELTNSSTGAELDFTVKVTP